MHGLQKSGPKGEAHQEESVDLRQLSETLLAEMANQSAENAKTAGQSFVQHAINCGRYLVEAKRRCEHGEWMKWLADNCEFSSDTAQRYMKLAKTASVPFLESADSITEALEIARSENEPEHEGEPDGSFLFEPDGELGDTTFFCDCGEEFTMEVWHCPGCAHHWPLTKGDCGNCHEFGPDGKHPDDGEPEPQSEPVEPSPVKTTAKPRKNWVLLDEWEAMEDEQRAMCLKAVSTQSKFNKQDNDNIEWAKWSWNPVTGCKHDCPYCYARDIANRFYVQKFAPSLVPERLSAPANTTIPGSASDDVSFKNVFTCSMADLFGRWVPRQWIDAVLQQVADNPNWNFLFLTKFPQRFAEIGELPSNAWMGTTVDCQQRVANAEKAFAKVTGGTKWLSVEPMMTTLNFHRLDVFDWVVIGGASRSSQTPEWRPPFDWVANLHWQARDAGCAIYHKTNLGFENRLVEFPWQESRERTLPESMMYLGMEGSTQ